MPGTGRYEYFKMYKLYVLCRNMPFRCNKSGKWRCSCQISRGMLALLSVSGRLSGTGNRNALSLVTYVIAFRNLQGNGDEVR